MALKPVKEQGFSLIHLGEEARSGNLASWPSQPFSVLVVLSVHANEAHLAWPSFDTIAELGGVSKSSVGPALEWLEEKGKIRRIPSPSLLKYRVYPPENESAVAIRRGIVRSGLWASLPSTARKAYFSLQAFSLPGTEPFYFEGLNHVENRGNWEEAVLAGLEPESGRHVLPERIGTAGLAQRCGVTPRAICMARNLLIKWNLVDLPDEEEGDFLILPNQPGSIVWLAASERGGDPQLPDISPGAQRSMRAWRKCQRKSLMEPQQGSTSGRIPHSEGSPPRHGNE